MRALLIITAVLVAALLLIDVGWPAFWSAGWTPPAAVSGRCWGDVCAIRLYGGATELSWGEYDPPLPVVTNGPPIIP